MTDAPANSPPADTAVPTDHHAVPTSAASAPALDAGAAPGVQPAPSIKARMAKAAAGLRRRVTRAWAKGAQGETVDGAPRLEEPALEVGDPNDPSGGGMGNETSGDLYNLAAVKKIWKTCARAIFSWWDKADVALLTKLSANPEWARSEVLANALTPQEEDAVGDVAAQLGQYFGATEKMMVLAAGITTVGSVVARRMAFSRDIRAQIRASQPPPPVPEAFVQ